MEATVDTTAPTTVTETTAPASPATADTSVSTPVVSDRPKSFKESFERIEAKQPPANKTAAATTAQPGAVTPPVNPNAPIPLQQHKTILENSRKELADYKSKVGWAEQIPQQTFQQVASELSKLNTDPIGYATFLISQIEAHPVLGPQWKARQPLAQSQATNLDPDVEVIGPDGKVMGATYSAERQKALLKHELDQALKPFQTERQQRIDAEQKAKLDSYTAEQSKQNEAKAERAMTRVRKTLGITSDTDPLFTDVLNLWAQHPDWDVDDVVLEVHEMKVKPRQAAQSTQSAISEMQRKAAGNTANGSGATAVPSRPRNEKELAAWMRNREAQKAQR